jgi:hypothetical protein
MTLNDKRLLISKLLFSFYCRKVIFFVGRVGKSLVFILIRLMLLAIAIVISFGLVLTSIVAENNAYAQWIIPSQIKDAYKQQQHIEGNNQTKILTGTTTIIHQFIKPVPEK